MKYETLSYDEVSFLLGKIYNQFMDKTVLCYIKNEKNQYLLMHRNKKENDINKDKYIGVGGHIEFQENKEEALLREVKEETNLTLLNYKYIGEVYFKDDDYEEIMYLYESDKYIGELSECNEGTLIFVNKEEILSLNLWEGDKEFLIYLLNEKTFTRLELIYKNHKLEKTLLIE